MSGTEYCNGEHRRHDLALFEQGVGKDSARVCTTSRLEDHNVTVNTAVVPMRFFSRCVVAMYFTLTFDFLQLYCPNGISPIGFGVAFPRENQLRQSRATQPMVHAGCFSVSIIHRTLTLYH